MQNQFSAFIDDLKATHGSNLASVILYGSAAAGDFIPARSDYNILIALHEITPKDLRNAHACVREWHKLGHPVPVYFTVSELNNAADVFPIEFHQMEVAHKVLYGTDVLAGLAIRDDFLRHQIEYELRSKLLLLRRQYIPASASPEGLKRLMGESLTSFSALFRAILLMLGENPPNKKRGIVDRAVARLGLDAEVFEMLFRIRENDRTLEMDDRAADDLFGRYLLQVEKTINSIDSIGKS